MCLLMSIVQSSFWMQCVLWVGLIKGRGYFKTPRTTFKDDSTHKALVRKIIPWVEGARENFNFTDKYSANRFLEILVNMGWVILQDYTVLIRKHKKSHFIITHMPEFFESAAFIDYSHKLSVHMAEQDYKIT